jgi:hypothetical protein
LIQANTIVERSRSRPSAQQMIMGLAQLPVGLLADSMVHHRGKFDDKGRFMMTF